MLPGRAGWRPGTETAWSARHKDVIRKLNWFYEKYDWLAKEVDSGKYGDDPGKVACFRYSTSPVRATFWKVLPVGQGWSVPEAKDIIHSFKNSSDVGY